MARIRKVAIIVGHNGPRTGAWWQDDEGLLDEWRLAQKVAINAAARCEDRGWESYLVTGNYKYPHHLYAKCGMVERIRPDIAVACHFGSNVKKGDRSRRHAGCTGTMFTDGYIPDESSFAAGVNTVFYDQNVLARDLAKRLVGITVASTDLTMANDDGLDPRPAISVAGRTRVYITVRLDPVCPVVFFEAASLSSPQDRKVLRTDPHIFNKLGFAVGAACDEWWLALTKEGDEP